jgi:hypothetical protein
MKRTAWLDAVNPASWVRRRHGTLRDGVIICAPLIRFASASGQTALEPTLEDVERFCAAGTTHVHRGQDRKATIRATRSMSISSVIPACAIFLTRRLRKR